MGPQKRYLSIIEIRNNYFIFQKLGIEGRDLPVFIITSGGKKASGVNDLFNSVSYSNR